MSAHLAEVLLHAAPDAQAVVILDQAGWHRSRSLNISLNIDLLPLPPKAPELSPVESIWQFFPQNWLSNRIFKGYDDILEQRCRA